MFQLFSFGEILLDTIVRVGDFLLYTPTYFTLYNPILDSTIQLPNRFGSIGSMILGGGLISLLLFRFIKFFLDIIF